MHKIFLGGNIITLDDGAQRPRALLTQDGVIRAMGDEREMRTLAPDAENIELHGATLMPGFIDGHSHITQYAGSLSCAELGGTRDFDDVARRIKELLKTRINASRRSGDFTGIDRWLAGFGYDHNTLMEKRHPARQLLDAATKSVADEAQDLPEDIRRRIANVPIIIAHASGHMGVLSSSAIKAAGIGADIPGGMIAREADGTPTGYMEEKAFMGASAHVSAPTDEEQLGFIDEVQRQYLSRGITTVQDGLTKAADFRILRMSADAGRLNVDVVAYNDLSEVIAPDKIVEFMSTGGNANDLLKQFPQHASGYVNRLRLGGYKLFLDGSPQGRTAFMRAPYTPMDEQGPDYRGYPVYADEQACAYVLYAARAGRQLLTHCNGDAAIDQLLMAQERACERSEAAQNRNVIIHAQFMQPDQLPNVKRLGMMPSYFAAHVKYWGDTHIANCGKERAEIISPLGLTERLNIPFTLHLDTPVLPPNVLESVQIALERRTAGGALLAREGVTDVSRGAAIRAITTYGAYQYFEEGSKGMLRPGMRADMIALDGDPLSVGVDKIGSIKVLETFKDACSVWKAE